jgi:hypothetical protein
MLAPYWPCPWVLARPHHASGRPLMYLKLIQPLPLGWVLFLGVSHCTAFQRACWINRPSDCLQNPTILCFQIETFIFILQLSACSTCSCLFFDCLQDKCPHGQVVHHKNAMIHGVGVSVAKAHHPWTVVVGSWTLSPSIKLKLSLSIERSRHPYPYQYGICGDGDGYHDHMYASVHPMERR